MNQLRIFLVLISIFALGCGTKQAEKNAATPTNAAGSAAEIVNVNATKGLAILEKSNDIIILDVRTPQEFASGHIKGAININIGDSDFKSKIESLDRDKTYFVYCASGYRSGASVDLMKKLKFKHIYHMADGIAGWRMVGNPLVK
ncbi:MAG: rhodanese-like domain-containing protein [Calditrichia bacterium]